MLILFEANSGESLAQLNRAIASLLRGHAVCCATCSRISPREYRVGGDLLIGGGRCFYGATILCSRCLKRPQRYERAIEKLRQGIAAFARSEGAQIERTPLGDQVVRTSAVRTPEVQIVAMWGHHAEEARIVGERVGGP